MTQTMNRSDADDQVKNAVVEELRWIPSVDSTHIGVTVSDGAVTLSGEVGSYPERVAAERAVRRVRGVTALAEDLTVRSTWAAVTDTDIAREAGNALRQAADVPDTVKITVSDRTITLAGQVSWHHEREAASRAVRHVRGIRGVVNDVVLRPSVVAAGIRNAIGAALLRNAQIEAEHITVTTDTEGLVTLEGTVTSWAESRQAEQVAWSAPGTSSVRNHLAIEY